MKKAISIILIFVLLFTNSSCKRKPILDEENVDYKIGMVTDIGGVNDQCFNEICLKGLKKYKEDHPNVKISYLESKIDADYAMNFRLFAENDYDIIIGVGYPTATALKEVALEYPNIQFAIIDDATIDLPNVTGTIFSTEQAAYLVGIVAAMMTKYKIVGFVGGMNNQVINSFGVGYLQGVMSVDENIEVLQANINSFVDSAAGSTAAKAMISQGADVIFQAAGPAGTGAINCCVVDGVYAIGVDVDQSYLAPNNVLTSAVKKVDEAVYQVVDDIVNGKQKNVMIFDIKNGGVDIASTRTLIPDEVIKKVEEAKEKIISGEIIVENDPKKCPKYTLK